CGSYYYGAVVGEELPAELPAIGEEALAPTEAEPVTLDTELVPPETILKSPVKVGAEAPQLRFAEDVLKSGPTKPVAKPRKKKKGVRERSADDGIKLRKRRQKSEVFDEEEEY
ncbi:unnamed protein product, partial [marine sediment metagenome]